MNINNLKNTRLLLLLLIIGLLSCESEKKYTDYNEHDFYEVQGIISSVHLTTYPFDNYTFKDISFNYFLDRTAPKKGIEKNLDMLEAQNGYPLIVLVHKEDENISFYGRVGVLTNLNNKEKEVLSTHIQYEMEKLKEKRPYFINNALNKDKVKEN